MNPHRSLRSLAWCLAVLLALGAAACGVDEYSPDPAEPGPPAPATSDLAFKDPADASVTSIDLTTSVEYDADLDEVRIFARVEDQDGNPLFSFNRYNFSVVLHPASAPRPIDPADTVLDIASSDARVVALVIDSSGSMSATVETGATRMQVAKEAAALFVDLMGPGDLTAIVDFDDEARILRQLTDDQEALKAEIDKFTASGATNLGGALIEAVRAVGTRPGKRAVVLLTDGDDTVDAVQGGPDVWMSDPTSTRYQGLELAKGNELVVFTVGLGADLSETGLADLRTFAEETGGEFFQAVTAQDLLTAFGVTVPSRIDALVPVETYELSFPNPVHPPAGMQLDVLFRVGTVFENANGVHRSVFDGTYTVGQP